ncbi:hypothetical protein [Haloarchaeobius sp. DFWS5]|uniref:hypothetical protein n=1 Tax=Haloarchaeobius sp. DFWS5 TaxID=3446114 RepID=UPI003EB8CD40
MTGTKKRPEITVEDRSIVNEIMKLPWRIGNKINKQYYSRGKTSHNPKGQSIFDRDWDNLIILDAARADTFTSICSLEGKYGNHISLGAGSHEFVRANFAGKDLRDTVIVTANAFYQKVMQEEGYKIHDLHAVKEYEHNELQTRFVESGRGGWNMPGPVTEKAKEFSERYPNKRLVIHYHQPHSPYIGETGVEFFDDIPHKLAYKQRREINVSEEILERAYRENLEIAIKSAGELVDSLTGKTVVSADHGEMLGERGPVVPIKYYGHMTGLYTKQLTNVPWFIIDSSDRKSIERGSGNEEIIEQDECVDDRLRELGYKI